MSVFIFTKGLITKFSHKLKVMIENRSSDREDRELSNSPTPTTNRASAAVAAVDTLGAVGPGLAIADYQYAR